MGLWNTLAGMFGRSATPATEQPPAPATAPESATKAMNVAGVRSVLNGQGAGGWASDHRAETEKFTGWHYIAIHSIAMAAAQAEVLVFDDAGTADTSKRRQAKRKSLRARCGSVGRWKSLYGGDDRETDPLPADHPLMRLMKRPNPTQSGAMFRYEIVQQIRLTGSAFIWNVPNRLGRVCERYVLPTQVCTRVQPSPMYPQGGWRVDPSLQRYPMVDADGFTEQTGWMRAIGGTLPAEQVQIIKLPHPLYKDDGQSPISAGALWADTADQIDHARFYHLRNAGQPSLLVTAPPETQPSPDELLAAREILEKQLCGAKNAGRLAMASGGTTITELGTSPKDMSYDTGFEQSKSANLAIHQTPPVAAGIQEAGAYAAYLASMRQFTATSVQPLLDLISEEDSHVIAPQFGPGLVIEIEAKSFDDPEQQERELANDLQARARTKNEWRSVRGLPPISAELGGDDWVGQDPTPAVGMYPNAAGPLPLPTSPGTAEGIVEGEVGSDQDVQVTADAVLNGAQITAATGIVTAVAMGEIPRDAGMGQLMVLFNLTPEKAEQIMGSAGTDQPTTPNPKPAADPVASTPSEPVLTPLPPLPKGRRLSRRKAIGLSASEYP